MENGQFEQGSIRSVYLKQATPTAINMIICIVYSMADTFFVAQTQSTGMVAGVSLCAPIIILLMALGNFLTQGGVCLVSRLVGERNLDGVRQVTSFCFYGTVGIGLLAALILLTGRAPILRALGATEETYAYTLPYYTALAAGAPIISLSFLHTNLMRGEGYTRDNMIATLLGAIVNIVLDPILILRFHMGTQGAGIATVIGYAATCLYALAVIPRRDVHISMAPALARIPRDYTKDILGVGLSSLSLNLMSSVSMIALNNFLVPYGSGKVAAMGIAMKLVNIAFFALDGYAYGAQPPAGYYLGAREYDKLRQLLRFVFAFLFALGVVLSLLAAIFARQLGWLFLKDPEIIKAAVLMLRIQLITIPLVGLELLITVLFQSFGRSKEALILSFARTGYVFLPVILLLSRVWGYPGVIAAQTVTDAITMAVALGMFLPCVKQLR